MWIMDPAASAPCPLFPLLSFFSLPPHLLCLCTISSSPFQVVYTDPGSAGGFCLLKGSRYQRLTQCATLSWECFSSGLLQVSWAAPQQAN